MYKAFEVRKRDKDSGIIDYYILKDGSPEWMRDVCRNAHDNAKILPDDYRYAFIHETICILKDADEEADVDELREMLHEQLEPSVYTSDLTEWLNSSPYRVYYLDEAKNTYGADMDAFQLLSCAQKTEMEETGLQVLEAFNEIAEAMNLEKEE